MGKRIAVAAGLVVLLAVAGHLLFGLLFAQDAPEPAVAAAPESAPQPAEIGPAAERHAITVREVSGRVERRGTGASWVAVQGGDVLAMEEAIRTEASARAVLDIGETATVEITPESQFAVREISETVARVRIDTGRIAATVRGQKGKLRVETRGSDAVAESSGGEFDVLASGTGQLGVATRKGNVRLTAREQTVEVGEGKASVVLPGLAPAAPQPVPTSLFLKLAKPGTRVQRNRRTTVRGATAPGAVISVNGVRVHTDPQGKFAAEVPLNEGNNRIVVQAEDIAGRRKAAALPPILVKPEMAETKTKARWGQKSKDKVKW